MIRFHSQQYKPTHFVSLLLYGMQLFLSVQSMATMK